MRKIIWTRELRRAAQIGAAVFLPLAFVGAGPAHVPLMAPQTPDSAWEGSDEDRARLARITGTATGSPCEDVEPALVVALTGDARAEAVRLLESVSSLELDQATAARLMNIQDSNLPLEGLAALLVSREISRQLERRRSALGGLGGLGGGLGGGWSRADQLHLERLSAFHSSLQILYKNPILARASAKIVEPPAFEARTCDNILVVSHLEPQSFNLPVLQRHAVIVFFEGIPTAVVVERFEPVPQVR